MNFVTTIGYHDAYFEVEVIISNYSSKTKADAERLGNSSSFFTAILHKDKIVLGKKENIIIRKEDKDLYQFKICRNKEKSIVSDEDYEKITWDEAIQYFITEYDNFPLPFPLEAYYFGVHEEGFNLS